MWHSTAPNVDDTIPAFPKLSFNHEKISLIITEYVDSSVVSSYHRQMNIHSNCRVKKSILINFKQSRHSRRMLEFTVLRYRINISIEKYSVFQLFASSMDRLHMWNIIYCPSSYVCMAMMRQRERIYETVDVAHFIVHETCKKLHNCDVRGIFSRLVCLVNVCDSPWSNNLHEKYRKLSGRGDDKNQVKSNLKLVKL